MRLKLIKSETTNHFTKNKKKNDMHTCISSQYLGVENFIYSIELVTSTVKENDWYLYCKKKKTNCTYCIHDYKEWEIRKESVTTTNLVGFEK